MLTAGELMTVDPLTLAPTDTLRFASGVLTSIGASGAPVMDDARVVGVVTMTDILEFAADSPSLPGDQIPSGGGADAGAGRAGESVGAPPGDMAVPEGPDWDALDEHVVAEIMSLRILSVPPAAPVRDLAGLMESEGVHRVLVMEGDQLVGIVTALDLVRAIAGGELVSRS